MRYEASQSVRRLAGRTERRGAQTGFPTWGAFGFGGIFVAVGTAILLVGARVIPVDPNSVHAPWWVLTVMGVVFALAGLAVCGMGVRQYQSERRRRETQRLYPDEPARADYAWDMRGFEAPRWSRAVKGLAGVAGLSLFLSIFNYWAFVARGPWVVKAAVILFDLFLLAAWAQALILWGRAWKFGGSRIEFGSFPYRLGGPVALRWRPASGIVKARRGTFTLRCVEEWFEHRGSGKNRSAHLVQEEKWSGTWHLDQPRTFTLSEVLEFRFDPPASLPPTQLSAAKPVFWEFEVKLDLPGLDFEEIYLAPIY